MTAHHQPSGLGRPTGERAAPTLFDVPLPQHPTGTQLDAAARLAPVRGKIEQEVYGLLVARWEGGFTPKEIAAELHRDVVTIRARLTELHQRHVIIRSAIRKRGELVYFCKAAWKPEYGTTPSRRHRGLRGQTE